MSTEVNFYNCMDRGKLNEMLNAEAVRLIEEHYRIGSRVTCNPAPTHTDDDRLVLVDSLEDFAGEITSCGFIEGGSEVWTGHTSQFASFTRDEINVIATESREFFQRFIAATGVSRKLNILDKRLRIQLFQAVLYGKGTLLG